MFFVTYVDNHGDAARVVFHKTEEVHDLVVKLKERPRCVFIQVTIDHGKRPPEEPGLATVDGPGYDWIVVDQFLRHHSGDWVNV